MISLIVADDRALIREGIHRMLSDHEDIRATEAGASGSALAGALGRKAAEVLLLGVARADPAVIATVRSLAQAGEVRVLLLLSDPEPRFVSRALRAGAAGICTTDLSSIELAHAIRRVASGERYLAPGVERSGGRPEPGVQELSRREIEVLRLLGAGRTSRQIAEHLGLSPKTISTYRGRIMEKLNLRGTAEIVRFALERGLSD